jgi:Tol biopolymer transport system component
MLPFICIDAPVAKSTESSEQFDRRLEAPALTNIRQVTAAAMGFVKAGEAYFSPDDQTVIFQAVPIGHEHYQIYTLPLSDTTPRMVSTGSGACTCAYFRPDGKKIIFASSHTASEHGSGELREAPGYHRDNGNYTWDLTPYMNIYEANPDGSELTALTTGPEYHAECAYSSDGQRIVFASNCDGSMNIYTMKADGSDLIQVTYTSRCYNGGPFFSPDDQSIVFRADRQQKDYLQIYMVNSDGSSERQLTDNGAVNWAPYWHPNGSIVAYTTSIHGHAHYEIYLLNVDSGKSIRLTHHEGFDGLPVFSHDGSKLLWTSKRSDDGSCQIFIADFEMPPELL